jgi:8-oxo-dGTP pyrophosphatase MutT (NUDIX family)
MPPAGHLDPAALDALLRPRLESGVAVSALAREIAAETGLPRRVVYQRALTLRGRPTSR